MMNFPMLRSLLAGAAVLLGLAFVSPAAAQRADDMRGGQNPCVGDAQSICSEFIPDRGKVASCLFRNKRKLTPACRAELGGGKATVSRKAKGKRHGKRKRRR